MKKIFQFVCIFFVALTSFANSQMGEKMKKQTSNVGITFLGAKFQLDTTNLPTDFKVKQTEKKPYLVLCKVNSDKWRTITLSGTANENGNLRIMFTNKLNKNPLYFDNLKINGKLVSNGDFSLGNFDGWYISKKKQLLSLNFSTIPEGRGISAWTKFGFIARDISVKKGEKIEMSIDVLCEDSWAKSYPLDLSKYHNISLGDKESFVKNAVAPKEPRLYGGMKFNFVDKNGAPNIAFLKNSKVARIELKDGNIKGKYLYFLYASKKSKYQSRGSIILRFQYKDGRRSSMFLPHDIDLRYFDEPVKAIDNSRAVYVDDKKNNLGGVYISRCDIIGGGIAAPLDFIEIDSRCDLQLLALTISSKEIYTTEVFEYAKDKWVEIDTSDMEVKEGTALDLTYQVQANAPAGKYGRLVVGENGTFEFEKRPGVPVRFKGANFYDLTCKIGDKIKSKDEIDRYIKMLKKQGFNALRWRFSAEKGIFDEKNGIKKEYWDLYDYFLYALGREGIYSYFYLASHDVGEKGFNWNERSIIKMRMMLGDESVRQAWRKFAKMQLEHINPYTKLAWKDDPSIATIEYWNEFDLGYRANLDTKTKKIFLKRYQDFLRKRYNNDIKKFIEYTKELKIKFRAIKKPLDEITDFSEVQPEQYHPDTGRFAIYLMQDVQNFYRKVVFEEVGMKVLTFQHNCVKNLFWAHCSASIGSTTAINTYHDIMTGFNLGAKNKQTSSIHTCANYWRGALSRNVAGMPLTVTEYQHCYPNKYYHELSLMFAPYSAFQDFSGLMEFDSPVAKNASEMNFRRIGVNPVHRVSDFLTNFFYTRGDVEPSKNRVDIVIKDSFFKDSKFASGGLHQEQSKIALLTGLKLSLPDVKKVPEISHVKIKEPTLAYEPAGVSKITQYFNATEIAGVWESTFSWDKVLADLKAKGILTADNRTDPKNEIFETDNKQIYMDCKKRLLQVNTPKSVGTIVNPDSENLRVGSLLVKSANVNASVALVAIDNKKLEDSSRLVLTFATDSVLKSSKYSISRRELLDFGKPPVLIETGQVDVEIKTNGKNFAVYPLKMNGERMKAIESKLENGVLKFTADNRKTPSLYFEIVAK